MTERNKTEEREANWASNWKTLMKGYDGFANTHRDLAEITLKNYKWNLGHLFAWLVQESGLDELKDLDFKSLVAFVLVFKETHKEGSYQGAFTALKSFLHFCLINGHVSMDLRSGVPSTHKYVLSKVPYILSDENVAQMLGAIDRTTILGRRDYAMILLMMNYGIRGIQVRRMKLQDIHWRSNEILIQPGKRGKAVEQPLTLEVGNALVDYLQNGRPQTTNYQEVFLTTQPPWRPLAQQTVSSMVARRLEKAGIKLGKNVRKGGHLFRHLFATKMLKNGIPLDHIAEMLGHRSENSTLIYTKIDFDSLMEIAQEWPEVVS